MRLCGTWTELYTISCSSCRIGNRGKLSIVRKRGGILRVCLHTYYGIPWYVAVLTCAHLRKYHGTQPLFTLQHSSTTACIYSVCHRPRARTTAAIQPVAAVKQPSTSLFRCFLSFLPSVAIRVCDQADAVCQNPSPVAISRRLPNNTPHRRAHQRFAASSVPAEAHPESRGDGSGLRPGRGKRCKYWRARKC